MTSKAKAAKTLTITTRKLRDKGACNEQVALFREKFGEKVEFASKRAAVAAAKKLGSAFKWDWAAENLLSAKGSAEYRKARDAAWAECQKVRGAAWAEYKKARDAAAAKYEKVKEAAWAEYKKVREAAWAEYEKVAGPAWAEYRKVTEAARAKYEKVSGPPFAAIAWDELAK